MPENLTTQQSPPSTDPIARATAALEARQSAQNGTATSSPTSEPSPQQTVAEVAKTIVKAAAGEAPPQEQAPPEDPARAARLKAQEERLKELRANAARKREEQQRAYQQAMAEREREARERALAEREAKLKEQEQTWKRAAENPLEGFKALGFQPEAAFTQISKQLADRNAEVKLTAAEWQTYQQELKELKEAAAKKADLEPDRKELETVKEQLKRLQEERNAVIYAQKRAAREQEFLQTVEHAAPDLLVEFGDRLLIGLADQLADAWSSQGHTHWTLEELALELKKQHDAHEQAKAERRAKFKPAPSSPSQQAAVAHPGTSSASSQESGPAPKATTQTLTNALSSSTSAAAERPLSAKERERRAAEKLQARMNAARRT